MKFLKKIVLFTNIHDAGQLIQNKGPDGYFVLILGCFKTILNLKNLFIHIIPKLRHRHQILHSKFVKNQTRH